MSEKTTTQMADELYNAVDELYKADRTLEAAIATLDRARLRRNQADVNLARLVPWSAEDQHINIQLSPLDDVLVTVSGEPAGRGKDCNIAPLKRILDLARIKRDLADADTAEEIAD
jgi:hypothetical protein